MFSFQAGELPGPELLDFRSHLEGCAACGDRLRFEDAALAALKAKLPRASAPPGLDERIRAALRAGPAERLGARWYGKGGWLAAAAVAAVLALVVLVPQLRRAEAPAPGTAAGPAGGDVTVVDLDCDRAGRSFEEQRRCAHPRHVNALRLADGSYWTIAAEPAEFRHLLLDPAERGRTLRVRGRLLGGGVIRIESADRLDARRPRPSSYPRAVPAVASSFP